MTVDEKVDQAMIAVGDETGMRDDVSDEETDENESDDENQDEAVKQKRQLCKFFGGNWFLGSSYTCFVSRSSIFNWVPGTVVSN